LPERGVEAPFSATISAKLRVELARTIEEAYMPRDGDEARSIQGLKAVALLNGLSESVLTEHGHALFANFLRIASEWRASGTE